MRIAERWSGFSSQALRAAFLARVDDPDPMVRRQFGASLGGLAAEVRNPAAAALLGRYGNDAITVDATLSGLRGSEIEVFQQLLASAANESPNVTTAVTMLAATIQALEVQRMTLSTLKSMNMPVADIANAFRLKPAAEPAAPARPVVPAARGGATSHSGH